MCALGMVLPTLIHSEPNYVFPLTFSVSWAQTPLICFSSIATYAVSYCPYQLTLKGDCHADPHLRPTRSGITTTEFGTPLVSFWLSSGRHYIIETFYKVVKGFFPMKSAVDKRESSSHTFLIGKLERIGPLTIFIMVLEASLATCLLSAIRQVQ